MSDRHLPEEREVRLRRFPGEIPVTGEGSIADLFWICNACGAVVFDGWGTPGYDIHISWHAKQNLWGGG